jgi:hypothetical protein
MLAPVDFNLFEARTCLYPMGSVSGVHSLSSGHPITVYSVQTVKVLGTGTMVFLNSVANPELCRTPLKVLGYRYYGVLKPVLRAAARWVDVIDYHAYSVRCAFFGRNLHSRMPLDPTPARLKRADV